MTLVEVEEPDLRSALEEREIKRHREFSRRVRHERYRQEAADLRKELFPDEGQSDGAEAVSGSA